jgi:uncharacterized protein YbaP (TraB family)
MRVRILFTMPEGLGRLMAVVASAVLALFASPAHAEPAMWVVKDADSTIYLLGTFHLTKPGMTWRSDKIDAAFKESNELWLEASENGDQAMLQGLVTKYGFDPAHPLSSKLSGEDWARAQSAAKAGGVPVSALERMRPWLAAISLVVAPAMKQGYDPAKGADKVLEASAVAARKTIKSFETPEQHIVLIASLSKESEITMLVQSLDDLASRPDYVDRMADAWMAGDIDALEAMSTGRLKGAPELYDTMFVRRNLNWCDQIAVIMKGAGTTFVAVGAGHLVGDQSVPAILAERGFTVTPY